MRTPEPIVGLTVCSICGCDWDAHGENPTLETCIKILRAELARTLPTQENPRTQRRFTVADAQPRDVLARTL